MTDNLKTRIAEALIQAWGKQTYGTPNQIAADAYNKAAREMRGEFARINNTEKE